MSESDRSVPVSQAHALEVQGVSKRFVGQLALDGVSLDVGQARVRALLGHNGSGKSTLIKVLAGYHRPDAGEVLVDGEPLKFGDPQAAHSAGLRFVHQDLGLVAGLTVQENLRLGTSSYVTGFGRRIRWSADRRSVREMLSRFDVEVDVGAEVEDLTPIQRTQLAIVRALTDYESARVLILDEPTASLPDAEVRNLFEIVRRVVSEGVSVLYVSHRLQEIEELCDDVTVLRDGVVVGDGTVEKYDRERLVELIVGRAGGESLIGEVEPSENREPILELRGVAGNNLVSLDLDLRPGEILGLAGLTGSGVNDLPGILLGRHRFEAGTIELDGEPLTNLSPPNLIRHGIAVLPADRGLSTLPSMSVRENLTLVDLAPMWKRLYFANSVDRAIAAELVRDYDVRPADPERPIETLSGGNQRKVGVAKWLRTKPRILVLDEPTAGIDAGGREQILALIAGAAQDGMAVLVCSSDTADLADICTRVVVINSGRSTTELTRDRITSEQIAYESYHERTVA